jgi:hypothetical protein
MKISRTFWATLLAVLIGATGAPQQASAQAQSKPNILFIMGDDIVGCSRASIIVA